MLPEQFSLLSVYGCHHTYDFSSDTATVFKDGVELFSVSGLERDGCRVWSRWCVENYLHDNYHSVLEGTYYA